MCCCCRLCRPMCIRRPHSHLTGADTVSTQVSKASQYEAVRGKLAASLREKFWLGHIRFSMAKLHVLTRPCTMFAEVLRRRSGRNAPKSLCAGDRPWLGAGADACYSYTFTTHGTQTSCMESVSSHEQEVKCWSPVLAQVCKVVFVPRKNAARQSSVRLVHFEYGVCQARISALIMLQLCSSVYMLHMLHVSLKKGCRINLDFSRMRSRRVPVLKLGSRGPGGDTRSLRLCSQASASVRGVSDLCRTRKSSRNTELSSLFTFRITKVSTITGIGGVVVAKPRTVVNFGLVSRLRVSKVSTITGIGGVVVSKLRTVVTFGFAPGERKGERRKER